MKIRLIGDVHIGKKFPYTTVSSALEFARIHDEVLTSVSQGADEYIQLGDLFDGFSVSGETLVRGYRFAQDKLIICGNHDKANDTTKSSALHLMFTSLGTKVIWDAPVEYHLGNTTFHIVPHQLTQEKFEEALLSLKPYEQRRNVILLHCNYGTRQGNEIENYLRPEMAKNLLDGFDLIVSGHEHNFSKHFGGRLIMLGSVLPFSFGEMKDKFVADYDTETGEVELIRTWDSGKFSQNEANSFVEMTGQVTVEQAASINKLIADWYKNREVIAVKNSTTLIRHEREAETHKAEDWYSQIMKQCNESQQALLEELYGELP